MSLKKTGYWGGGVKRKEDKIRGFRKKEDGD